ISGRVGSAIQDSRQTMSSDYHAESTLTNGRYSFGSFVSKESSSTSLSSSGSATDAVGWGEGSFVSSLSQSMQQTGSGTTGTIEVREEALMTFDGIHYGANGNEDSRLSWSTANMPDFGL